MQMPDPFISVIVPTYNRANMIAKTLTSLQEQNFKSYEIIVVDDGSTDKTEEVVKAIATEKTKYLRKVNGERGAARNYGWERARGTYVTFLDSDDVIYKNFFNSAFFHLKESNLDCYAQAYEIVANPSNPVSEAMPVPLTLINHRLLSGNFLSCFGVFLKRELLNVCRFSENYAFSGTEDWLLWLQLAARFPFFYNKTVTGALIQHADRSVLSFPEDKMLFRVTFICEQLEQDSAFIATFGRPAVERIRAHMLSYTALHLSMHRKHKRKVLHYIWRAYKANPAELWTRRSAAILRNILLHQ